MCETENVLMNGDTRPGAMYVPETPAKVLQVFWHMENGVLNWGCVKRSQWEGGEQRPSCCEGPRANRGLKIACEVDTGVRRESLLKR